jgi:hypothetical protein
LSKAMSTDPAGYGAAMKGCDAAINLVGIIREFPAKGESPLSGCMWRPRPAWCRRAQHAGVLRYLQMSALGTRLDAVSGYHRTKWRGEEIVRGSGLAWTIFRPSLIFGPRDAFVNMLADNLRLAPVMPTMGDGNLPAAADPRQLMWPAVMPTRWRSRRPLARPLSCAARIA